MLSSSRSVAPGVCHWVSPVLERAFRHRYLGVRANVNKPFATFDPLHGVAFAAYRQAFSNPVCVVVRLNPLDLPQNETRKNRRAGLRT